MASLAHLHSSKTTLGAAVEAFFADRDLAPATRRAYRATYGSLLQAFGTEMPVTALTPVKLRHWLTRCWGKAAPATWNARLAASRVLIGYCQRQGWIEHDPTTSLERRRTPRDETRAIPFAALDALWSRADIGLREKTLWRMLYATAARASEVLALDVEDLDVGRKRAAISGKGGHREIIVWDAATARLLPRYLAGRRQGPLFVTTGLPNIVPAELDRSPDGRGRLSYQRAWSLFHEASGGQWTLHQLRHSALTHLGENGVSAPCSWPSHAIETSGRSRATCVRGPKRLPNSPPSTTRQGVGSIHAARAVTHRNGMISENTRFSFHCYSDPGFDYD